VGGWGRTAAGGGGLAWARWDCLSGRGFSEPEPRVDKAVKKAVRDRYYQLAASNFSHFSGNGTAWQTYAQWHGSAVAAALDAGMSRKPEQWTIALTRDAFAGHFLTDAFSAGHIRTPRTTIKEWYGRQVPGSEPFVRYMSRFMYRALDAQGRLPWLLRVLERFTRGVIEDKIRKLGGEALGSFSLGDIVSKALHDYDNAHGVAVLSDVDASGRPQAGGFPWTAIGDSHLASSKFGRTTKAMAVAAVEASLRDLRRVRDAAGRAGQGQLSLAQRTDLIRQALGTPMFEARRYLPRERVGDPQNPSMTSTGGRRAPLEWRWGQLGPLAYQAVDDVVKGDIAIELSKLAPSIQDSTTQYRITVRGIRTAYEGFVKHLQRDGIAAIEAAVGRRAR